MLIDEIKRIAKEIPAELKEKKGLFSIEFTIAERKGMFAKKKLTYEAKFRLDEVKKELRFTEMLKESRLRALPRRHIKLVREAGKATLKNSLIFSANSIAIPMITPK